MKKKMKMKTDPKLKGPLKRRPERTRRNETVLAGWLLVLATTQIRKSWERKKPRRKHGKRKRKRKRKRQGKIHRKTKTAKKQQMIPTEKETQQHWRRQRASAEHTDSEGFSDQCGG